MSYACVAGSAAALPQHSEVKLCFTVLRAQKNLREAEPRAESFVVSLTTRLREGPHVLRPRCRLGRG
jgi:hypothetical protein